MDRVTSRPRNEAETVTVLVIEISDKSYSPMWPSSSSSSSPSGLEDIPADTFLPDESPNQKAGSPTRELACRLYMQWKAIQASLKKRKMCIAFLEQTSPQACYLFWDIISITYETEQ